IRCVAGARSTGCSLRYTFRQTNLRRWPCSGCRRQRQTQRDEVQLFRSVEMRLLVGVAVFSAANFFGRANDAPLDPTVERLRGDAVSLGLGGPRLAALPRIL